MPQETSHPHDRSADSYSYAGLGQDTAGERLDQLSPHEQQLQLLEQQKEQMLALVEAHKQGLTSLTTDYESALDQADPAAASDIIAQMSKDVPITLADTRSAVMATIDASQRSIRSLLSPRDESIRQDISTSLKIGGLTALDRINGYIAQADNPPALQSLMDRPVINEMARVLDYSKIDKDQIDKYLPLLSTDEVREAVKAAIDAVVLEKAGAWAGDLGRESRSVGEMLECASSPEAKQAILGALDMYVDQSVADLADKLGPRSSTAKGTLKYGSNRQVRSILSRKYLGVDFVEETVNPVSADPEITALINKLPGANWLHAEDPTLIRVVRDRVLAMRTQKDAKDRPYTDKMIYLEFRRAAAQAEAQQAHLLAARGATSQGVTETQEQREFKILNALMKGDPSEKIET